MLTLSLVQAIVDGALLALIWIVQRILYPELLAVPASRFQVWHATYMQRIGQIVGPLMVLQVALEVVRSIDTEAAPLRIALIALAWVSTAVFSVPLHRRLQRRGKNEYTLRLLVWTNWPRTVCWSLVPFVP